MANKVALVTGAAVNIGLAIASRLARDGYDVGLTSETGLDAAVEAVQSVGRKAVAVPADLRNASLAEGVVREVVAKLGRLDVLVNNAGWTVAAPIEELTDEQFDDVFSVNFKAGWIAARSAAGFMRAQGKGSITFISSIHSVMGMPGHSVYAATKGAINASVRELAIELGPSSIRVNAICPGLIETPRYFEMMPGYTSERGAAQVPLRRVGTPADVARAVSWISSDEASFVTGQCLLVDGGSSVQMPIVL